LEYKKVLGKGYDPDEIGKYIADYEAGYQKKHLELECRIEDLSQEVDTLKRRLEPLKETEKRHEEWEKEIRDTILSLYLDATGSFFKAAKDFEAQEQGLNQKMALREAELSHVKQVTHQLREEINVLTQGYAQVLKGER
jgi:chromosome segregation ATPase